LQKYAFTKNNFVLMSKNVFFQLYSKVKTISNPYNNFFFNCSVYIFQCCSLEANCWITIKPTNTLMHPHAVARHFWPSVIWHFDVWPKVTAPSENALNKQEKSDKIYFPQIGKNERSSSCHVQHQNAVTINLS
jgi:hypothetical protein